MNKYGGFVLEIFRKIWANKSIILATALFFGALAAVYSVFVATGDQINPISNILIAIVIGFLLALIILIISMLFDSTVKKPEDIVEQLGANLLGVIPKSEGEGR